MIHVLSYEIADVKEYINWSYFFHAWGFAHKYSTIADYTHDTSDVRRWINSFTGENERNCAEEAANLYKDAAELLAECNGKYKAYAKFGIFEANSNDDDIIIYDENGKITLPCLRQQTCEQGTGICLCLADYLRPVAEQGTKDRIGLFAATVEESFENQHKEDNYRHMLCQTLADRLAEAATELTHLNIRKTYWGYAKEEKLTKQQLFSEKFQGIRPAIGYPSLPDQSIIFIVDKLIDLSEIGITITESGAMKPHASTCGLIFAHPKARYFSVGKISKEQAEDYACRRGLPKETIFKFLQSNIQQ